MDVNREPERFPPAEQTTPKHRGPRIGFFGAASFGLAVLAIVAMLAFSVGLGVWDGLAWIPPGVVRGLMWMPVIAFGLGVLGLGWALIGKALGRAAATGLLATGMLTSVGALLFLWAMSWTILGDYEGLRASVCLRHARTLCRAALDYADQHKDAFPPAARWSDELLPYVGSERTFRCPNAPGRRCAFAYNSALAGVRPDAIADAGHTVLVFESDRGWNAAGGPELLSKARRLHDIHVIGFADGHVKAVRRGPEASRLVWQPKLKQAR